MTSADETIRRINKAYAGLLRDIRTRHPVFERTALSPEEELAFAKSSGGLMIPTEIGAVTSFQYSCFVAVRDVHQFWETNSVAYLDALRTSESLKLTTDLDPDPHLLLYFDTVTVHDPLPACRILPDPGQMSLFALRHLNKTARLLPLLEADTDVPLIAFIPIGRGVWNQFRRSDRNPSAQDHAGVEHRIDPVVYGENLAMQFLQRIAQSGINAGSTREWLRLAGRGSVRIHEILRPDAVLHLLQDEHIKLGLHLAPVQELLEALQGQRSQVSSETFAALISCIFIVFTNIALLETSAFMVGSDPLMVPELYGLKLELDGREAAERYHLEEEQVAAFCVSSSDFEAVSTDADSIIAFREDGGPKVLRDALREQRTRIRHSRLEGLEKAVNGFTDALRLRLDAHADEIQQMEAEHDHIRRSFVPRLKRMGVMIALNALVPSPLSIPLSFFLSAPTILDLHNDRKRMRQIEGEIKSMRNRPICVFERALGPGRPVFRWPWLLS